MTACELKWAYQPKRADPNNSKHVDTDSIDFPQYSCEKMSGTKRTVWVPGSIRVQDRAEGPIRLARRGRADSESARCLDHVYTIRNGSVKKPYLLSFMFSSFLDESFVR